MKLHMSFIACEIKLLYFKLKKTFLLNIFQYFKNLMRNKQITLFIICIETVFMIYIFIL